MDGKSELLLNNCLTWSCFQWYPGKSTAESSINCSQQRGDWHRQIEIASTEVVNKIEVNTMPVLCM